MLIDTSGFFSLHDRAERHHRTASKLNQEVRSKITTNYVLAEYVALTIIRGLSRPNAVEFSREILKDDSVEIVWIDEDLHLRAVELLEERADKSYSLCDAASFVIMRDRGLTDALTTDKHFEQEGFVRMLK